MKPKHTPGPWKVDFQVVEPAIWKPGGIYPICTFPPFFEMKEDDYANAKLISSAPKLLIALQEILELASHAPGCGQSSTIMAIESKAKAAIEKAVK